MEQSNFSAISRRNADKNLLTILLAAVSGSLAFHLVAIAGVTYLWKPAVAMEEPMEITMVDVDAEKPVPQPTPVIPIVKTLPQPKPKPDVTKPVPIVKVPAKLDPPPDSLKPVPITKVTASLNNSAERTPVKPVQKSIVAPQPKTLAAPSLPNELFKAAQLPTKTLVITQQKIAKSSTPTVNKPKTPSSKNQSGLATNSSSREFATRSLETSAQTQNEDFEQVAPSKVNAPNNDDFMGSSSNQSGLISKSSGGGRLSSKLATNAASEAADDNFEAVTPSKVNAPNNDDFIGSSNNQSGLIGKPSGGGRLSGRLAGNVASNTTDDNFEEITPSKTKAPNNDDFIGSSNNQSGLTGKPSGGGKLGGRIAGNNLGSSGDSFGRDDASNGIAQGNSWRGARAEPGVGSKPNSDNGNDDGTGSGGIFGLQCISRCEISGLTELEDQDGGKDKLRIKIAINSQGNVTSASIAKSSGNPKIDRIIVNGVRQMEFSPPGKIVVRVVKANILL